MVDQKKPLGGLQTVGEECSEYVAEFSDGLERNLQGPNRERLRQRAPFLIVNGISAKSLQIFLEQRRSPLGVIRTFG
jgi:hypothetical protein